jgi:hypothetical protein
VNAAPATTQVAVVLGSAFELPTTASPSRFGFFAGHGDPEAQMACSAPAPVRPAQPTNLVMRFPLLIPSP